MIPRSSKTKILIVDDVATIREWVEAVLEREGFEVASTDQPTRMMPLLISFQPELVLMDVSMPDVDGDKLVGAVRHAGHRPIVVLYSTLPIDELKLKARTCGAHAAIHKDWNPQALVRRVNAILEGDRSL